MRMSTVQGMTKQKSAGDPVTMLRSEWDVVHTKINIFYLFTLLVSGGCGITHVV